MNYELVVMSWILEVINDGERQEDGKIARGMDKG
ncbi:MAG: hypothetical protein PWQ27_231 [Kosmotoga sp.]|nr:hypothetical protein [Kosmotoga sp.]